MIAGIAKTYNLPFDYVLNDLSYANIIMYGAVIPHYIPKDRKGKDKARKERPIKADDRRNKARVRQLINSFD